MQWIFGNWKMNGDAALSKALVAASMGAKHKVVLCPPYTLLHTIQGVTLGAQDCAASAEGAFTGDVSAKMLRAAGCEWVILGHSERRQHHAETDALIAKKLEQALAAGLKVVLCVGETEAERKAGQEQAVVSKQLSILASHKPQITNHLLIAYEPVWAIGSGLVPTAEQITTMHRHIAKQTGLQVLYGGSVKPENAAEILALEGVSGLLVGGASLQPEGWKKILQS